MTNKTPVDSIEKIEKAYGGCHNCYGKGYSTYRHATTASGDFIGEKDSMTPFKVHMLFCKCDRGKQLSELISQQREELAVEIIKLIKIGGGSVFYRFTPPAQMAINEYIGEVLNNVHKFLKEGVNR